MRKDTKPKKPQKQSKLLEHLQFRKQNLIEEEGNDGQEQELEQELEVKQEPEFEMKQES